MNNSRSTEMPNPSPATGTRARIGHVVRWHAEPVSSESPRDSRDAAETAEKHAGNHTARPL
jgi:hypothetical protein